MEPVSRRSLATEFRRVFVHARWPVQSYVVLAFLCGAVFTLRRIDASYVAAAFAWLMIVVGLTVLNSYYDKDEAPVGGMQRPPKVNVSLLYGAWILLAVGLLLGAPFGLKFWLLEAAVVVLDFFYSYDGTRWKTNGYMAVGINAIVGALTLLGAMVLGRSTSATLLILGALCAAAFKASVYSMMQIHQIEEDKARGDLSFAVMHGRQVTLRFSQSMLIVAGVFAVAATLVMNVSVLLPILAGSFFLLGVVFFEIWIRLPGEPHQDSLRMQRMIHYSGYIGTLSFFALYLVLLATGVISRAVGDG